MSNTPDDSFDVGFDDQQIIVTPEAMGTLSGGAGLPPNFVELMNRFPDFAIETHTDAPPHPHEGGEAAQRFRRMQKDLDPIMRQLPNYEENMKTQRGRRNLLMGALALKSMGQ